MVAVKTLHSSSTDTLLRNHNTEARTTALEKVEAADPPCNPEASSEFSSSPEPSITQSWYLSDDSEDNTHHHHDKDDEDERVDESHHISIHHSLASSTGLNLTHLMKQRKKSSGNTNANNNNNDPQPQDNKLQLTTLLSVPWALDVGLSRILPLHTESFLSTPRHVYTSSSSSVSSSSCNDRLLYVTQAEVAHATPKQCDVLVSDRATTCHILAFYSHPPTTKRRHQQQQQQSLPFATLTHLDGTMYESCIRTMIQQHKCHHLRHAYSSITDTDNDNQHHYDNVDDKIHLDIHIVGGYEDAQGSSRAISNWLILLLLQLASEEQDTMVMNLKTCAMTCLNHQQQQQDHHHHPTSPCTLHEMGDTDSEDDDDDDDDSIMSSCGSPRGRGMALDVRTGHVQLAHVADEALMGPLLALRAARLWANSNRPPSFVPTLSVITRVVDAFVNGAVHDKDNDDGHDFIIEPFDFEPWDELDWLLTLSNDMLLQQTSTSPDVEEDDYCDQVRKSLELIRDWDVPTLFGANCDRPLLFKRRQRLAEEVNEAVTMTSWNDWVWIPPIKTTTRVQTYQQPQQQRR